MLVRVVRTQGSVPREVGAWMAVWPSGASLDTLGTVGGGRLEHDAIATARAALAALASPDGAAPTSTPAAFEQRYPLGPSLGQCCGGVVWLAFEPLAPQPEPAAWAAWQARLLGERLPVALFGGGHVGRAIVQALASLPFALTWIDSRDEVFPTDLPPQVVAEHSDPVERAVPGLAAGTQVLVMSFSHAEDLAVVQACLDRIRAHDDLPFVGLIGSATKWATFGRRLRERGYADAELARITCPIGLPGLRGKHPAVIAASVAAQLLLKLGANGTGPND
jgi:xanthine dehydrogenase accessory factor